MNGLHVNFGEPFGGLMPGARGAVLAALLRTGTPLTGRRIHALLEGHSLGAVQQALRDLESVGVITTETIGRAGVRRTNEHHETIAPLRSLASPIEMLTLVVRAVASDVEQFVRAPEDREPVVTEILRDGLPLVGTVPRPRRRKVS